MRSSHHQIFILPSPNKAAANRLVLLLPAFWAFCDASPDGGSSATGFIIPLSVVWPVPFAPGDVSVAGGVSDEGAFSECTKTLAPGGGKIRPPGGGFSIMVKEISLLMVSGEACEIVRK